MLTGLQRLLFAPTSLEAQLYPPLKLPVRFRPYTADDFDSCIEIYKKNETGRFPEGHIKKFEHYLGRETKTLIVAEHNGRIVGYGGINLTSPESAVLCYGIIDPEYQKQRIGATLMLLRIAHLLPQAERIFVMIFAVDASLPIYERFGFREICKWKYSDRTLGPVGALVVASKTHRKIQSMLNHRGIRVEGNLALHPPEKPICRVEKTPAGRFHIHFIKESDDRAPDANP